MVDNRWSRKYSNRKAVNSYSKTNYNKLKSKKVDEKYNNKLKEFISNQNVGKNILIKLGICK